MTELMTAVCGLDCSDCTLLKASQGDPAAAAQLADWWHSEGWLDESEGPASVIAAGPHCLGCHGDRATHWSANCWILQCAVDDHGVESCDQCDDFPCERLVQWASQNEKYLAALDRLRQMRDAGA